MWCGVRGRSTDSLDDRYARIVKLGLLYTNGNETI